METDLQNQNEEEFRSPEKKELRGLGGWLALVGIGIILSTIINVYQIYGFYVQVIKSGLWQALTTQGGKAYQPVLAGIIASEMVVNGIVILLFLYMAILYFSKNRRFPKFFTGVLIFVLIFTVLDLAATCTILPFEIVMQPGTIIRVSMPVFGCLIWIPYMRKSKRVKATFVRPPGA